MKEDELEKLYSSLGLAMTFKDFLHIRNYYKDEEHRDPTMTEILSLIHIFPTAESLRLLAPHKTRKNILAPMRFVQQMSAENQYEIQTYRHVPKFVPAGQSTQMIIGATPEQT